MTKTCVLTMTTEQAQVLLDHIGAEAGYWYDASSGAVCDGNLKESAAASENNREWLRLYHELLDQSQGVL